MSTTGHGESITKACLAYTAILDMEQGNLSVKAINIFIFELSHINIM